MLKSVEISFKSLLNISIWPKMFVMGVTCTKLTNPSTPAIQGKGNSYDLALFRPNLRFHRHFTPSTGQTAMVPTIDAATHSAENYPSLCQVHILPPGGERHSLG